MMGMLTRCLHGQIVATHVCTVPNLYRTPLITEAAPGTEELPGAHAGTQPRTSHSLYSLGTSYKLATFISGWLECGHLHNL